MIKNESYAFIDIDFAMNQLSSHVYWTFQLFTRCWLVIKKKKLENSNSDGFFIHEISLRLRLFSFFLTDVSCLIGFEHFNIVWSLSPEYMHAILQGMSKRLLNFFIGSKYSNKEYYIHPAARKILNRKILNIRPTSSIVRKARSLNQMANFKASEYRSMLLYYLPICLPGSVPNVYVKHVRLLSAAVYILLKKSIPTEEVDRAERMLLSFVQQHQQLFGEQNMVMVVHLVQHLAESVRQLGPLWCHSAFPFERNNGCLLKLVSGTTDVLHQISSKYCLSKSVKQNDRTKANTNVHTSEMRLLGKAVNIKESASNIFDTLSMKELSFDSELSVYKRVKFKKIIYTSTLYTRPKRSIDYFIGLSNGKIGKAKYYFNYKTENCVLLQEYEIIDNIDHISRVLNKKQLLIARIVEIEKKFIFMNVGLNSYVVSRPNPYENE